VGIADNWLRHIRDVADRQQPRLDAIADEAARLKCLCELNVIEQVLHVGQTTVVEDAWQRGQDLTVHGWVYGLHDGRLRDLGFSVSGPQALQEGHAQAVERLLAAYSPAPA
jgi:carbonic anhydrase